MIIDIGWITCLLSALRILDCLWFGIPWTLFCVKRKSFLYCLKGGFTTFISKQMHDISLVLQCNSRKASLLLLFMRSFSDREVLQIRKNNVRHAASHTSVLVASRSWDLKMMLVLWNLHHTSCVLLWGLCPQPPRSFFRHGTIRHKPSGTITPAALPLAWLHCFC